MALDEGSAILEGDLDALELEDLSKVIPIRGRTMGFMGPTNSIRVALYKFLVYRCVVCLVLAAVPLNELRLQVDRANYPALDHVQCCRADDTSRAKYCAVR